MRDYITGYNDALITLAKRLKEEGYSDKLNTFPWRAKLMQIFNPQETLEERVKRHNKYWPIQKIDRTIEGINDEYR